MNFLIQLVNFIIAPFAIKKLRCAQPVLFKNILIIMLRSSLFCRPTVKPVAVHILTKEKFVSSDKRYEVECKSSGSRPEAIISWHKGNRQIKRLSKNVSIPHDMPLFRRTYSLLCMYLQSVLKNDL